MGSIFCESFVKRRDLQCCWKLGLWVRFVVVILLKWCGLWFGLSTCDVYLEALLGVGSSHLFPCRCNANSQLREAISWTGCVELCETGFGTESYQFYSCRSGFESTHVRIAGGH